MVSLGTSRSRRSGWLSMINGRKRRVGVVVSLAMAGSFVPAVAEGASRGPQIEVRQVSQRFYDGRSNDLLTAGLGFEGLRGPRPGFADPANPTPEEARRLAIWSAMGLSSDPAFGFGRLFGPNIDENGQPIPDGKVAGTEYIALADDGTGQVNVALMVQVPRSFDRSRPCLIAGSSTGLANYYSAVIAAGAFGLRRGCAVAYTDKGMGPGFHDLSSDTVMRFDGTTGDADEVGDLASFRAPMSEAERQAFASAKPFRIAHKMAHSKQNPMATWGRDVVLSIRYAFHVLNTERLNLNRGTPTGRHLRPANTTVMVSSWSNGGGSAIAAAEEAPRGLIDGVVAREPQMYVPAGRHVKIYQGARRVRRVALAIEQYSSLQALLVPCAALTTPGVPGTVFDPDAARRRCQALVRVDPNLILRSDAERVGVGGLPQLAQEALVRAGFQADADFLQPVHYDPQTPASYVMSHARADVRDMLCGYSWAAFDAGGRPRAYTPAELAAAFTTGGRAPAPGGLINELSANGPIADNRSTDSAGVLDYNLAGERCVYDLAFGRDSARAPGWASRVQRGLREIKRSGDLQRTPTIIVHGRLDTRVPVNHTSRPYLGLNRAIEGRNTRLRYIEVTNAHHFDLNLPVLDVRTVSLWPYYEQAMRLMWAHLTEGAQLPANQVVHTKPRGGTPGQAPPATPENIPPIKLDPAAGDRITVRPYEVRIPD
jgi:hydroxybutyrate-dimer hydrolase